MDKFECPICENENQFDKLFHHHVYLIGYLLVSDAVNDDENINKFFNSTLANCRQYHKSKEKNES